MSDPSIKGAKRSSSRPAPHSASQKSSAKGRKVTTKAAKPKPKRGAAEKAPVRKASPAKSASASKTARLSAKQSKRPAAKPAPAKKAGVKASAPSKSSKSSKSKPAAKPHPSKSAAKSAPAKSSKSQASKSAAVPQRTAPRRTPEPPRQPSRDEAAALKAFERAHKEFARGNFTTARDLFRTLIDQHGGVSEVTARARTYLNIAETRLQREAALPRDPDSLYDRGVIELNRGDFVSAQEFFERALKRDPDAADTHYALAATRARLGATEAALHALERALELKHVLRVRAQSDADLAPLRNDPEFERIVFSSSRP
jgi:tetratricopeptide (TPR) repeat protein